MIAARFAKASSAMIIPIPNEIPLRTAVRSSRSLNWYCAIVLNDGEGWEEVVSIAIGAGLATAATAGAGADEISGMPLPSHARATRLQSDPLRSSLEELMQRVRAVAIALSAACSTARKGFC